MNKKIYTFFLGTIFIISSNLYGQGNNNCFLNDFEPKTAVIPAAVDVEKPTEKASVKVTLKSDTIGKVSKYVYGNAIVAWAGSHTDPTFVENTKLLAPSLIRFPGGSWADGWFLDKIPSDVPDSVYDGTTYNGDIKKTKKNDFGGHWGKEGGWVTTTDQYYALREKTGVTEGLITVNYAYARYGTSIDPVAKAAQMAADWVRYDAGRTKFWEIGNENGGPWEYGWMIDTALNQDGQPIFISGELYGKHFKVFVDSMKKAANEIGDTIYIGGQVIAATPGSGGQWGIGERAWNEGFFKEVGDTADFYVVHNYFDNSYNVNSSLTSAINGLTTNANYVKSEITKNNGFLKPITLTEYNGSPGNENGTNSYVNGMQAVVLICEMIKNNFGLGARWMLEGMFSGEGNYANHPHAEFYYLYFLQKIYGDLAIATASSSKDILSYATKYSSSGEVAMVIANKGNTDKVLTVSTDSTGVGNKYYIYTFTGGTESEFSPNVYINGNGPNFFQWGPFDQLLDIEAKAYTIDKEIKFVSPAKSIQMIMIEAGTNHIIVDDSIMTGVNSVIPGSFKLNQNYPNPCSSSTFISYQLYMSAFVTMKVFDSQGREVKILVNENQNAGYQSVQFNASNLQSGVYYYSIEAGQYRDVKKLTILK
jgi:hypothetical protein